MTIHRTYKINLFYLPKRYKMEAR